MSPKWSDLWKELREQFQSIETAKSDLLPSNDLPHPAEKSVPRPNKNLTLQLDSAKKDKAKMDKLTREVLTISKKPKGDPLKLKD